MIEYDNDITIQTEKDKKVISKKKSDTANKNKLIVPYGRRSSIVLADGSKVWLNAGSSIMFPDAFDGNERRVYVEGEIYIEVARDVSKPFYVETPKMDVSVLGTKFNVSAYADDATHSVVLVEGKVNVALGDDFANYDLVPNQRLSFDNSNAKIDKIEAYDFVENSSQSRSATLLEHFKQIEQVTDYVFIYSKDVEAELQQLVELTDVSANLDKQLSELFENTSLTYMVNGKQLVVKKGQQPVANENIKQEKRRRITGTVIDTEGEPLIGVNIMQEGTSHGTITDYDGNYVIELQGSGDITLVFSYIGMQQQSVKITPQSTVMNVTMREDSQLMDEVVVVAYGVRKKGTIAGSVSTVKAEKLENVPTAGFDQALQGQSPGLMVMSNSGEPSKAATFQIRGTNSINSGTAPLFILDGVPISSSDFNTISPSDIESVSVLKDASSTSIYGARAANGVVVITTKRGTALDKAKVVFRSQVGVSQLARSEWNLMDTDERIAYEKEIGISAGQDYDKLRLTNINWRDVVFNNQALLHSYDLSVSRATDVFNYFVSGCF